MQKLLGIMFALAFVLAVTTTALGANSKAPPQVTITKNCIKAKDQKTYEGNVIVYVSGKGCVSIDDGAVAIASGNATVVAHGHSTVYAKDNVILIVYNRRVECKIGPKVTLINTSDYKDKYIRCRR